METTLVVPIRKITMHSDAKILARIDKLTPPTRSASQPKYRSGTLLVELACALILVKNCLNPGAAVFWVISLSWYGNYTCDRNSMGDRPVFFLKTELK